MMEPRPQITEAIFEVVENQLSAGDPPETKSTYERLVGIGYSDLDARKLLADAVLTELNEVMRQRKPFNRKRFGRELRHLPKLN
ncbi:MAG: hypothetical protein O2803_06910 [Chloroflexi bacterium]|nr:hypothetical protein [Chloroflexota bacterium]